MLSVQSLKRAGGPRGCKYSGGSGTGRCKVIKDVGLVSGVPACRQDHMAGLIHTSLASSTWKKYGSA